MLAIHFFTGVKRPEYKVLEIGELPHDLAPEDNILDTFF